MIFRLLTKLGCLLMVCVLAARLVSKRAIGKQRGLMGKFWQVRESVKSDWPQSNGTFSLITGFSEDQRKRSLNDTDTANNKRIDSVAATPKRKSENTPKAESSVLVGNDYQYHPNRSGSPRAYQDHPKWPEYCAWCRSHSHQHYKTRSGKWRASGTPTATGFVTWLGKQAPQWRDRVDQDSEQKGYLLNGKFLTADQAKQKALKYPELITTMRPAIKRDGKIILQPNSTNGAKP